jgi:hypothetical protein
MDLVIWSLNDWGLISVAGLLPREISRCVNDQIAQCSDDPVVRSHLLLIRPR